MSTSEVLDQIDAALEDWSVGPDAMRCNAPAGAGLTPSPTRGYSNLRFSQPRVELLLRVDIRPFVEAINKVAAVIAGMSVPLKALGLALTGPTTYDENHPRPLCIDGHAYRRRTKRRRR